MGNLIGVFGGTFDPPHIGHCILAEEAWHLLGLDCVYWVPAGEPPHKPDWPVSPIEDRIAMVKKITVNHPWFELSRVDVDRQGPHFAKDTLKILQTQDPKAKFVYLMGSDSLRDLMLWKQPEVFVQRAHAIGIMHRPGIDYDLETIQEQIPAISAKLQFFPAPLIEISGQMIRRRIKDGLPVRFMVTRDVYDLILQRSLYHEPLS
jgi:nicotinate-nucleotide adenylyltransferase